MLRRSPTVLVLAALVAAALASASAGGPRATAAGPPSGPPPGLDVAIAAQERHTDELLEHPGVVGTGVGLNPAGRAVVRIYVEAPAAAADLPNALDGVPAETVTTGIIMARAPTDRFPRPVPIGVSSGHPAITAGTLGSRVTDGTNVYALSNNHVYANINSANIGDGVIQPGTADGGSDPADRIGTLAAFQTITFDGSPNTIDAAIALTSTANVGTATPADGYGTPSPTTTTAFVGQAVKKYGRTTALTTGTVAEINVTVDVCYVFFIVCLQQARFVNQISITPDAFSAGGDSGSLIVTQAGNQPVALLFAGGEGRTVGNPIDLVLQRFGVTIDGIPPPATVPDAPTGLSASPGDGAAHLTWQPPAFDGGSPVIGYKIYRGTSPGGEVFLTSVGPVTAFDDTGLANGTQYFYKVAAENSVGEGPFSNEASVTPAAPALPDAPTAFSVLAGDGAAHLAWAAPASDGGSPITGYRIHRGASPGSEVPVATVGVVTSYDDPALVNGNTYYYEVSALNAIGEGALTGEEQATPSSFVPLDAFNRPDENPLSDAGRWGNGVNGSAENGLRVSSNELASGLTTTATGWRSDQQYGPDAQAWGRVSTLPGTGNAVRLYVRLQTPGSSAVDGYMLRFSQASGTDQVFLERITNNAITTLATINREVAAGNRLLFRAQGSTLEAWLHNGTTWTRLGRVTDSTYGAAGFVGVGIRGTTGRVDDFGGPLTFVPPATPPGPPLSLSATPGDGAAHLSWQPPASDGGSAITGYRIYRGTSSGSKSLLASVGAVTSYDDAGLTNGDTYYYEVSAVNAVGEGPPSNETSVTPAGPNLPGAPQALSVLAADGAAHLAWDAASDGGSPITGYRIYRGTSSSTKSLLTSIGPVTSFDDTGLTNGNTYYYEVSAVNSSGEGPRSGEAQASPAPFLPLDAFNRPNENPLSDAGRWSNGILGSGERGLKVVSNLLASGKTSTTTAWRSNVQYGPDAQAWARVSTLPGTGNAVRLYVRLQTQGSSAVDGYMLRFSQASGTDQIFLERITNGAITTLATINREVAAGNRLLLRAQGPTLEAWLHNGTTWTRIGRTTDSTYGAAGYIGVGIRGKTGRVDDFGGP